MCIFPTYFAKQIFRIYFLREFVKPLANTKWEANTNVGLHKVFFEYNSVYKPKNCIFSQLNSRNFETFPHPLCLLLSVKCGKEGKKLQKFEYYSEPESISFINQENEEITKIDWRIDSYKI